MKVAVTGATGFIGRHVVAELLQHPLEIIAITRQSTIPLPQHPQLQRVQFDLQDPSEAFQRLGQPQILIHLAWAGLPNYRSLHHFEQELPRQYGFLKQMVTAGLESLLVTGTCFEYGLQSGALGEDLPACPITPYGYAKQALRQQLQYLQAHHPFNLIWTRLFYLYGEGQAPKSLLPQLKQACERGDPVFNMSGGEQLRDYLPVETVARMIVALALKQQNIGLINLCSGQPISIRKLVEDQIRQHHWSIDLNLGYYPYPEYEPMAFWGDRRKLGSVLEEIG